MAQAASASRASSLVLRGLAVLAIVGVGVATYATHGTWLPVVRSWVARSGEEDPEAHADEHDHAGHGAHEDADSIKLSAQARKNIGLKVGVVELKPFTRTITLPGMVVERPGRSTVQVTTPMTGIVTRIHPIQGQAVQAEQKLFELRLTHEEIVQAQSDLLRTAEELDVVAREIARLERVTAEGVVAGKTLLERKYEQQKLEAIGRAQQQSLLLHGLTAEQVKAILKDRSLLQHITIYAPPVQEMGETSGAPHFQVQELNVVPGQYVNAGAPLAVLANYATLFIEGSAFERDATEINRAAKEGWPVTAMPGEGTGTQPVHDLRLLYTSAKVEADSRLLHFYVDLPNEIEQETTLDGNRRFFSWRFRPGQRMQLLIPVETLPDRIVLPVEAVAADGAEAYVFTPNGDQMKRRPVHVEYRNARWAVIANDGALFPGDAIALSAADQLQLAIKSKSSGPIDPHAGHNH
jgi:cobalt-zinc-cadmium efflux system membrane fusion protein